MKVTLALPVLLYCCWLFLIISFFLSAPKLSLNCSFLDSCPEWRMFLSARSLGRDFHCFGSLLLSLLSYSWKYVCIHTETYTHTHTHTRELTPLNQVVDLHGSTLWVQTQLKESELKEAFVNLILQPKDFAFRTKSVRKGTDCRTWRLLLLLTWSPGSMRHEQPLWECTNNSACLVNRPQL